MNQVGTLSWKCFEEQGRRLAESYGDGWKWIVQRTAMRGGSFLAREPSVTVLRDVKATTRGFDQDYDEESLVEDDPGRAQPILWSEYHVVYSIAFQTPALYFRFWTAENGCGSTASSNALVDTAIERIFAATPAAERGGLTTHAMISQDEHPVLGTPFWFLHPCSTSRFMSDLGITFDDARYLSSWITWAAPLVLLQLPNSFGYQ